MKAEVTYYDAMNDVIEIKVGKHHLSYGGMGDGYCYAHQSFDCELTAEERMAVQSA
jgi:hypothetical protein